MDSITISWATPLSDGGSDITAYDLRHIETDDDETVDPNWTVVEDVWTTGSGALEYTLTGLTADTQYDIQVRAVNSVGDGPWSVTNTATLTTASVCLSGGAVADPANTGLVSDCEALLSARDTLAETGSLNWSADTPITKWDGITVRGTPARVAWLNIRGGGLDGSVPAELGELSSLTYLNLRNNGLSGPIPTELGNLTKLTYLGLNNNMLTGPIPDLSRMTRLQQLYLSNNDLSGDLPDWMGTLTEVKELWLWGNELEGPIPDLSGMIGLDRLKLQNNQFTGGIPTWFGEMTNLRYLYLHYNPLGGTIPAELGDMSGLRYLWLHNSQLTGSIPAELGRLSKLWDLNLHTNRLDGSIPAELGGMDSLQRLRLHRNMLSGQIPAELGDLENLRFMWLHGNILDGSIPAELGDLTKLERLWLSENELSGQIPVELGDLSSHSLVQWRLSGEEHQFTGCLPAGLAEVKDTDFNSLGLQVCTSTTGQTIIPLGLVPPVPGSCGNGTYDTPVPVTGLLGGNKSPSWRSDCAEIAYVQNAGVSVMKRDGEHLRDLYRYEPGGSVAASGASWTAWSPDGTRLALAVENLGSGDGYWARHIWVIEADGSNMVQLTSGPQWDNSPSWSPDGNQIVFHRSFFEGDSYIVTIDVDSSTETPLTAGFPEDYGPSWSPDGATIGYVTEYGQLALMAPDGSNRREIVANHAVGGLLGGMSWSPDSSQIAYTRDLGECTGIVLINADGTDERRISYLPGDSSQPAWSPDGELLLFANAIVRGLSKIYIVSVHGGSRDGLEEGCAQVERYEPNQDVAAPDDWQSRLPQEAAPASTLECRPPDPSPGGFTVGFPRPTWVPSVGKLRMAVLFVDFPDGVADYSTREEAEHDEYSFYRTNLVAIEEYLETASYGKLDVEMVPLHGWLRTRHSLTAFFTEAGRVSKDISVEAVELALAEMDFSEIDVVGTVLPSAYFYGGLAGGAVQISDKLIPTLHIGLLLNHVIKDTAGPWGFTGTHELAHVLGLTDLYPMNYFAIPSPPADMKWVTLEVGLMGLQGRYLAPRSATGVIDGHSLYAMLAWSRWQLGWLEPSQIRCIVEPSATVTLTAIDQPGDGVAMIAVPVGETEVIVIESRRIRAFDRGVFWGYDRDIVDVVNDGGVLVYTVDSSLRELPIRYATDGGEGILDQSPILPVGTSITVRGYEITVVEDTGDTHTVRISKLEGGN